MKIIITLLSLILLLEGECSFKTWNGIISSNYFNDENWTPNGIPNENDTILFNQNNFNTCQIPTDINISGIILENTSIHFEEFNIVSNNLIEIKNSEINGSKLILIEGNCIIKNSIIRSKLDLVINDLFIKGNKFYKTSIFYYLGTKNEYISGDNKYFKRLKIINNSNYRLRCSSSLGSTYLDSVLFVNQALGRLEVSYKGLNIYKSPISLFSSNGEGIRFGIGNGISKLDSIASLTVDSSTYYHGNLTLKHIIQFNSNQNKVSCKNNVKASFYNCDFHGSISITSPSIYLRNNLFKKVTKLIKTGPSSSHSYGNNTFNDSCIVIQKALGIFRLSNTKGNTYKGPAIFRRVDGFNSLQVAYSDSSYFYNDINFNSWNYINIGLKKGILFLESDSIHITSNQELKLFSVYLNNNISQLKVDSDLQFRDSSSIFYIGNSLVDFLDHQLYYSNCCINTGLIKDSGLIKNINSIKWIMNDSIQQTTLPLNDEITIEYINPEEDIISFKFHKTDSNSIANDHYSETWININNQMHHVFWEIDLPSPTSINFEIILDINNNYGFKQWNEDESYWESTNIEQTINSNNNHFKIFGLNNNSIISISQQESLLDIDLIHFESWCKDELIYIDYIFNSSPDYDYYLSTSLNLNDTFYQINQTSEDLYYEDMLTLPKNVINSELIYILEVKDGRITDYEYTSNCGKYNINQIEYHSKILLIDLQDESNLFIYDLNAKKVYQDSVKQNLINLSHLSSGIYILKLHNPKSQKVEFRKILIQ